MQSTVTRCCPAAVESDAASLELASAQAALARLAQLRPAKAGWCHEARCLLASRRAQLLFEAAEADMFARMVRISDGHFVYSSRTFHSTPHATCCHDVAMSSLEWLGLRLGHRRSDDKAHSLTNTNEVLLPFAVAVDVDVDVDVDIDVGVGVGVDVGVKQHAATARLAKVEDGPTSSSSIAAAAASCLSVYFEVSCQLSAAAQEASTSALASRMLLHNVWSPMVAFFCRHLEAQINAEVGTSELAQSTRLIGRIADSLIGQLADWPVA
ncbi:unnamed protein product [Protopolystoma xenopodis]|uniref:Uncharacterized protein n=1 Tax=Protopolystoma xenopodis TaxID=117903 RepID=A0A448X5T4_9PLAT|nr:unnamed protein product [Protopolystoma xenopodis]